MMLRGIRHLVFHDILWVSWCHPVLGFTETLVKQCREQEYHEPEVKRGLKNGWRWVEESHTKAGWEQPLQFLGLEVDRKEGNKREEALQWWSGRESERVKTGEEWIREEKGRAEMYNSTDNALGLRVNPPIHACTFLWAKAGIIMMAHCIVQTAISNDGDIIPCFV